MSIYSKSIMIKQISLGLKILFFLFFLISFNAKSVIATTATATALPTPFLSDSNRLTVSIIQEDLKYSCIGQHNGKFSIKIKGGLPPYQIFWEDDRGNVGGPLATQNLDSIAELHNLSPRPYTFQVFDSGIGLNWCFSEVQGPINMMEADFEVNAIVAAMPSCHGSNDGMLTAEVNLNGNLINELSNYQFIWQNSSEIP